ncbi:MAG: hypothetical protein WKG07_23985 [Hymenobacter sp.]
MTLGSTSAESATSPKFVGRTNSLAPAAYVPKAATPVIQEEVAAAAPEAAPAEAPAEAVQQAPATVSNVRTVRTVRQQGAYTRVGADGVMRKIAACESGGNYAAVSRSGKYPRSVPVRYAHVGHGRRDGRPSLRQPGGAGCPRQGALRPSGIQPLARPRDR